MCFNMIKNDHGSNLRIESKNYIDNIALLGEKCILVLFNFLIPHLWLMSSYTQRFEGRREAVPTNREFYG